MELTPELIEFVEAAIERVVAKMVREGWRPSAAQTVRCLWCGERMIEKEWASHKPRCPESPKVKRRKQREERMQKYPTWNQHCKECGAAVPLSDQGLCFPCSGVHKVPM